MNLSKNKIEKLIEGSKNSAYFRAIQFFKNEADIEEALQISYIKAFKKIDQLDDLNNFNIWFNRIVINTCKDQLKKTTVNVFSDISDDNIEVEDDRIDVNPQDAINYKSTQEIISAILNELPVLQRSSLYLYYYEEYSIKEISELFEVSEATVKSRLRYAKETVKGKVEEYQSKNDIKLYSTAVIPLISYAFMTGENQAICPVSISRTLSNTRLSKASSKISIKRVIISTVSAITVIGLGLLYYFNNVDELIELKAYEETIEYGDTISTDPSHYIKNTNLDVLNEVVITCDSNKGDYAPLGEHDLKIAYKNQELIYKIIVEDTIEPKFVDSIDELEIEEGSDNPDFLSYFKVEDLSDFKLLISEEDLDMNTPGVYKILVKATDTSGNSSSREVSVRVNKKEEVEVKQLDYVEQQLKSEDQVQQIEDPISEPEPVVNNAVVDKAISLVGTVNEGGFGQAGIGGSFVCDDLAEQALAAGGISYSELRSSGTVYPYAQAQPGDLLIYKAIPGTGVSGHVAIYIGNGMAVHGNFERVTTIFSALGLTNLQEPYVLR